MPTGQQYATDVPQAFLSAGISGSTTNFGVNSLTGWPTPPFTAILDIGTSIQEPIDVITVAGNTITSCTRAIDGTVAQNHAGTTGTLTHANIGRDFREMRSHIDASSSNDASGEAVHGLISTSAVVGTKDSQTLTNKTLISPVIDTPTLNGSVGLLTLPNGPDTLVGRATTDTLTNKTLTSPTIATATFSGNQTLGSGTFAGTGQINENTFEVLGITGANSIVTRYAGTIAGGPPTSGTFITGDIVHDTTYMVDWYCNSGGSPGLWTPKGPIHCGTTVLGSSAPSITINVPNVNYSTIVGYWTGRQSSGSGGANIYMQLNGDSASHYTWQILYGSGSTVFAANSGGLTTQIQVGVIPGISDTALFYGSGSFSIAASDSASTNNYRSVTSNYQGSVSPTNSFAGSGGGLWESTATVTSITLLPAAGNLLAGSSLSVKAYV